MAKNIWLVPLAELSRDISTLKAPSGDKTKKQNTSDPETKNRASIRTLRIPGLRRRLVDTACAVLIMGITPATIDLKCQTRLNRTGAFLSIHRLHDALSVIHGNQLQPKTPESDCQVAAAPFSKAFALAHSRGSLRQPSPLRRREQTVGRFRPLLNQRGSDPVVILPQPLCSPLQRRVQLHRRNRGENRPQKRRVVLRVPHIAYPRFSELDLR